VDLEETYSPPNAGFSPSHTEFAYNLDRQLELESRPDGRTIDTVYKPNGQLERVDHSQGSVTYTYDPTTAQVSSATSANGQTVAYVYDGNFVTAETWSGSVNATIARTYDNHFRMASRTVNGGQVISFGFDDDGFITQAGSLAIARDNAIGQVTGTTLGSITDAYGYNGFGEVSSYSAQFLQVPLYQVSYTRDAVGRITQKVETIQGQTHLIAYEYSLAGHLKKVTTNGAFTSEYEYDGNGNRLSHTTLGGTVTADYDAQDRLLRYGDTVYTWTANGELDSKTDVMTGAVTTFLYDELGNLIDVSLPGGDVVSYVVDAFNRRVGKKVNGVFVQLFLYEDDLRLAAELDTVGGIASLFVYSESANSPEYLVKGGTAYRVLTDQLGSPLLVVDAAAGTVAQMTAFDEFGQITSQVSPGFQPLGFAGGIHDDHTALTRFGARDYDANTGRWLAKDPIRFGAGDSNIFAYVGGDPVNSLDPEGLATYLCRRPIKEGYMKGISTSDWWNPFHHEYVCVTDERGRVTCGGFTNGKQPGSSGGALPNWFGNPGRPSGEKQSREGQKGSVCTKVHEDDSCVEKCVRKQLAKSDRPPWVIGLEDCQSYARRTISNCIQACNPKPLRPIILPGLTNETDL